MTIRKMAIADILKLVSVDSGYREVDGGTVKDVLPDKQPTQRFLTNMREFGQQYPIYVGRGLDVAGFYNAYVPDAYKDADMMGDGHHRVAAAVLLKWEFINVTDNPEETGREDPEWEWEHDF